MPTANPLYNPNWKEVNDTLTKKRKNLSDQHGKLYEQRIQQAQDNHIDSPDNWKSLNYEIQSTEEALQKAREEQEELLSYGQHQTIQECITSNIELIINFDPNKLAYPVPTAEDLEQIKNIEDAKKFLNDFYTQTQEITKQLNTQKQAKQPVNLNAFSTVQQTKTQSQWLTFTPLYPGNNSKDSQFFVITDRIDDEIHICICENTSKERAYVRANSATNEIEAIATSFLHAPFSQDRAKEESIVTKLKNLFNYVTQTHRVTQNQQNLHFYIYSPAEGTSGSTTFHHVKMKHSLLKGYHDPSWEKFPTTPPSILELHQKRGTPPAQQYTKQPTIHDGYLKLAEALNIAERTFRYRIEQSMEDFLLLEKLREESPRRALGVLRDISTEFDSYALNSLASYYNIITNKDYAHRNTAHEYEQVTYKKFGATRKCNDKIDKLLKAHEALGYPVKHFKALQAAHLNLWKKQNNYQGICINEFSNHQFNRKKLAEDIANYTHSMLELILYRNTIEHSDGVIHNPEKLTNYIPNASKGERINISNLDLARYIAACTTLMNHLRCAIDIELGKTQDSAINYTPTISTSTLIDAYNTPPLMAHEYKKIGTSLLRNWLKECRSRTSSHSPFHTQQNLDRHI